MHEEKRAGNWEKKPNQRRARQSIHLAIAAKCFIYFLRIMAARQMEYLLCEALEILVNMHRRRPLRAYKKPPLAHSLF
jgi:hypothetical protein